MSEKMKALVFHDVGNVTLENLDIPDCTDNGVLIKVARAGICGSDIHAYTRGGMAGGVFIPDSQFGHEFVGEIVKVGKNVAGEFEVGQRVWGHPDYSHEDPRWSCMAGGFAEYVPVVNAIKDVSVFVLPDDVSYADAVLIEPFGVATHTKNRIGVTADDKVLMYGAGPIGLLAYAAMVTQGVQDIIIAEQMPTRIDFARSLGADVYDNSDGPDGLWEYVAERFGTVTKNSYERPGASAILDYVGLAVLAEEYVAHAMVGSRFGTVGMDPRPASINMMEMMSKEYSIAGSRGYTPDDIKEVIAALQAKKVDVQRYVTAEFALEDVAAAFEAACDKNTGLKVVFVIDD